ncbi:unnamed protein product [Rotaria sordida]|uniref:Uncharacterized protein n=1 Tax=Rotaria sordida TaxID=392033 RepID=A0A819G157_9BILA|nr:unnamed protein product [Rotaria sordida]CAF1178749.1 unnamed protein product [Rotaria sordida]CAF1179150.1 unnamed protein product [Rotaria sordida]CAF1356575.1 unnamed protein product [Rotaria sordida]CAF3876939.1 unnamed protein product [Rotaria sordida]
MLLFLIIINICLILESVHERIEEEGLRYMVSLSEPLEKLIFRWNITLINGYNGLLAFLNHDLDTYSLDVIIYGNDDQVYNGYTDEESLLFIPKNGVELKYRIENKESIENGKKKHKITIRIKRPFDTCDEEQ